MTGFTPGTKTPAATTPHVTHPGPRQPGERAVEVKTVTADVPIDATGTVPIGTTDGYDGTVLEVRVTSDVLDYGFDVAADGESVYDGAQQPSSPEETFGVVEELGQFSGDAPEFSIAILSASVTGGVTATFEVVVAIERR